VKKKLGPIFVKLIGEPIPLKDEPRKMFTFCTRTVYLGADFYSDNARTFILSDANIDSLAVDISLDLPQIIGRQRLDANPWKNRAEFYYKINGKEIPREEFDDKVRKKEVNTKKDLENFDNVNHKDRMLRLIEVSINSINYKESYVGVNYHGGPVPIAVTNRLVRLAEERAFDIQQVDYKDRFGIFNSMANSKLIEYKVAKKLNDFLVYFEKLTKFEDRFRHILNPSHNFTEKEFNFVLDQIPLSFRNIINVLGVDRCRELSSCNITLINKECEIELRKVSCDLRSKVIAEFKIGEKYSKNFIKEKLSEIYKNHGLTKKKAKATDINEYFETKSAKLLNPETNKFDINGLEIVKLKD
jgi:hypothetical protein